MARAAGVGRTVVDSFDELDRLDALHADDGIVPAVLLRVTPGIEAHTHEYVKTGQDDSKFGFGMSVGDAARAVERAAASTAVDLVGAPRPHRQPGVRGRLVPGGHRGAGSVRPHDGPPRAHRGRGARRGLRRRRGSGDARAVGEGAARSGPAARRAGGDRRGTGRAIVAAAAVTLYTVGTIKELPGLRTYVAVDGGMSDNPRPVLYGSGYEAFLPRSTTAGRPRSVRIVGKHCESGDVWSTPHTSPTTSPSGTCSARRSPVPTGTRWVRTTTRCLAPPWCLCDDGDARVVVRRETYDDLLRYDD